MRWPLRAQILLPMVVIFVLTVAIVTALNAWLAASSVRRQLEGQLARLGLTLGASNFPLEENVLRQISGFVGAEFVVVDADRRSSTASNNALLGAVPVDDAASGRLNLAATVVALGERYLHAAIPLERRAAGGERSTLHVFYPEARWREARWQAVWPPPAIGAAAVVFVALAAYGVASRISRPIEALQRHVTQIAAGEFSPLPLPRRNDELRDLTLAVNRLAQTLAQYEDQTRKSERLRTLAILGGGAAHQLRNAATGCRIALDLHERDCSLMSAGGRDESLAVAARQLAQIEAHIQRLLTLGRPAPTERQAIDLVAVARQAIELVHPLATHMGVQIECALDQRPATVSADAAALVQLIVNLLINAVEAAARTRVMAGAAEPTTPKAIVELRLTTTSGDHHELAVVDSGAGPPPAIEDCLFEPFASDKPGGTGLGLAVAQQIAADHGGVIRWERRSGQTWFLVELPATQH